MKKRKYILPCLISVIASAVVSFGVTYAFYSKKGETNLAVTSGNIDFSANFGATTCYSALAKPLYDENVDIVEKVGDTIVSTEYGGVTYYNKQLPGTTFTNGGTVSIVGNVLSLDNISYGDKVKSSIVFQNDSSILLKYRVVTECYSDDPFLYQNLTFNFNGRSISSVKKSYSTWTKLNIGTTPTAVNFDIQLPMGAPSEVENKNAAVRFYVEAVQSNIYTVDSADEYFDAILQTAPTAISNLVYNGSPINLVTPGFAIGGTIMYKLDDGEYSTTIPSATNAGNYTVYYKVVGDSHHKDLPEASLNVSIGKADCIYVAPTANVLTYNGALQNLVSPGTATGGTMKYSLDGITYIDSVPQGKNAGDYTVYYKVIGDQNHQDTTAQSIAVSIAKANYDMTPVSWNYAGPYVYDGTAKTIELSNLPTGVTATYTNNSKVDAGDYVAHADLSYDEDNYNAPTIGDKSWSISKANPTCVAPTPVAGLVYSGSAQALINAGSATGGTIEYSLDNVSYSTSIPEATDAGNYTVYYKVTGDANHLDLAASSVNAAIVKADSVLNTAPTGKSLDHTGNPQDLVTAGSATGGILKYKLGDDGTYSESIPQATASGTYKVYYKVEETTNYNGIAEAFVTSTITSAKQSQTAPTAPTVASYTSSSITLNAATGGKTDAQYAVSTTNSAPSTGWITSTTFTGLTAGTKYYFFAKFIEDASYYEAVSTGAYLGMGYSVTVAFDVSSMTADDEVDHTLYFNHPDGSSNYAYPEAEGVAGFTTDESPTTVIYSCTFNNVISITGESGNYMSFTTSGGAGTYEFKTSPTYEVTGSMTITSSKTAECIDENSLITMADGTTKAMKDIEIGDMVLSIDYDTMSLVGREVIYTSKDNKDYDKWIAPCYYLHTFSDGTTIKRAMRHRFYCLESQSYKHMDTWENGLSGYKLDGTNPTLVSTEIIQEEIHYARITLAGSNNYFANGLSTGDSECCPNKVVLNSKLSTKVS